MAVRDSDVVIAVEGVTKTFNMSGGTGSLKARVLERITGRHKKRTFKALDDVSFMVKRGETLGIIGANGAGKSTLLALLTATLFPTTGTIYTQGQISSLLELGAGFHPDLTGRENIYLYGAIMGVSRAHMDARFDAIVDFAGLRDFIDQPVKHYSSGMYVRLGFAVAVEVNPDILLIDEVLAVGDSSFQRKCLEKMRAFRREKKTMLIISHDLQTIQRISDRIVLLDKGKLLGSGSPAEMIGQYEGLVRQTESNVIKREWGTGEIRLEEVMLCDKDGKPSDAFEAGDGFSVEIGYRAARRIEEPVFGYAISDADGHLLHGGNTQLAGVEIPDASEKGRIMLSFGPLPLTSGNYLLSCSVHSADHRQNYHRLDHAFAFAVRSKGKAAGAVEIPVKWELDAGREICGI